MKAQSSDYIQLQNVYKTKARKDLAEVLKSVRSVEKQVGRQNPVDEAEVEAFCKGAAFVKLVRGRPIHVPSKASLMDVGDRAQYMCRELQDEESLLPVFIAFQAYDRYLEQTQTTPRYEVGQDEQLQDLESSLIATTGAFVDQLAEAASSDLDTTTVKEKLRLVITELCRAGGGELHNISALTGGMVAQEVIKAITKQYIPVDNTCVFDGITSRTAVFKL